jgi:hypothetical protein
VTPPFEASPRQKTREDTLSNRDVFATNEPKRRVFAPRNAIFQGVMFTDKYIG